MKQIYQHPAAILETVLSCDILTLSTGTKGSDLECNLHNYSES